MRRSFILKRSKTARGLVLVLIVGAVASESAMAARAAASVDTLVEVPAGMRTSPFNVPRNLTVPPDFGISVYARIPSARFMAVAPNGDLLVSQTGSGSVKLVRPKADGTTQVFNFISGLSLPHDVVFHKIGTQTYVYISEAGRIARYAYTNGATVAGARETLVSGLPTASNPELKGIYGHQLKNIAVDPSHNLYVSIASASNADVSDAVSSPIRCAVYRYNYRNATDDYGPGSLFARGLRNAEGLAFVPGTDDLWVTVNNRDKIPYPNHGDITGDGTDDYGKVLQSYVDNHPPEEFTLVRQGADYGWPYANPNPDTANGMNSMPFEPDYNNNPNWSVYPASRFTRIDKGIQAHSAPLGVSFLHDTGFPADYRNGVVIALHGSWNRAKKTGYKVIYFPWSATTSRPGAQMDLVSGWLNERTQEAWGRPVDAVADDAGNLFISDNQAGAVYKLSPTGTVPPDPVDPNLEVDSFSLVDPGTNVEFPGYEAVTGASLAISAADFPEGYCLRANVSGTVESVIFAYNGNPEFRLENESPYFIKGDTTIGSGVACYRWPAGATIGTHKVTATPFSGNNGAGNEGIAQSVTITVSR